MDVNLQIRCDQKSAKRTTIRAKNSGKKQVKIAKKVSPKKSETPELKKVFKRLNQKAQNRDAATRLEKNVVKLAEFYPKKSCEKPKHKPGIKAKIEAFEHLNRLEVKKLEFSVSSGINNDSSNSTVEGQCGRGGKSPLIGESLNLPLRRTPLRITGGQISQ